MLLVCSSSTVFSQADESLATDNDAAVLSDLALLGSSDSAERSGAIERLSASRDGRVGTILEGYRTGELRSWNSRLVFPGDKDESGNLQLSDALTGEPILVDGEPTYVSSVDLKTLMASRKERRSVVNAVRRLELYSPIEAKRQDAIKRLGDLANPDYIDDLQDVIESESSTKLKRRAKESIALIRLAHGSDEEKLIAVSTLGELASARAAPILEKMLKEARDTDSADDGAISMMQSSLNRINRYQSRVKFIGYLFSGISLGSILLLMALGLSIVFGQMGVINMAHGELMMIGAYTTYEVQKAFGHSLPDNPVNIFFFVALPVSFLVAAFVGWLMEKLVVRHLYGRPLETLLATWGVGLILIQIVRIRYGDNIGVNSPTWLVGGAEVIQDFYVPYNRVFIIGLTAVCVALVYWLLNRTKRGLLIRATVQNREMASALGVNTRYEDGFTFALGAGLAGIAGCALTLIGGVTPDMGQNYIVDSFLVVVTGGVGEIAGAIWAGFGIGLLNKLLEPVFSTIWGKVLILSLVMVFIQYRPAGLFPPKGRLADV